MNATSIVNRLLEFDPSPYDIDDHADRPSAADYPAGFVATRGDDVREFKLDYSQSDGSTAVYVMRVLWKDDYTGKPRQLNTGAHNRVRGSEAGDWISRESARWQAGGWTVKML